MSVIWWLATGLLSGDHSACWKSVTADLAFASSHIGIGLAVAALVFGVRHRTALGWRLLALFAVLLGLSVLVFLTCG